MGKRGIDKIPADLRPAFQKAAAEATTHQRALAAEKGAQAIDELKKLGLSFNPMAKAERDATRKEMESRLWAGFAKEHKVTGPLFDAISKARA